MRGHEFADRARNESVWKATIPEAAKKSGSIPFDLLIAFLKAKAAQHFGIAL